MSDAEKEWAEYSGSRYGGGVGVMIQLCGGEVGSTSVSYRNTSGRGLVKDYTGAGQWSSYGVSEKSFLCVSIMRDFEISAIQEFCRVGGSLDIMAG